MNSIKENEIVAARLSVVTQGIGFALWQLQELENCAAHAFVLIARAKPGMGSEAGDELLAKALGKTFGATVQEMIKAKLLSPELERRFTNLLAERNWLVHKSKASSRSAVHRDDHLQALLLRLEAMVEETGRLIRELGSLAERHVKRHGVKQEQIEDGANQLLKQWHNGGAN